MFSEMYLCLYLLSSLPNTEIVEPLGICPSDLNCICNKELTQLICVDEEFIRKKNEEDACSNFDNTKMYLTKLQIEEHLLPFLNPYQLGIELRKQSYQIYWIDKEKRFGKWEELQFTLTPPSRPGRNITKPTKSTSQDANNVNSIQIREANKRDCKKDNITTMQGGYFSIFFFCFGVIMSILLCIFSLAGVLVCCYKIKCPGQNHCKCNCNWKSLKKFFLKLCCCEQCQCRRRQEQDGEEEGIERVNFQYFSPRSNSCPVASRLSPPQNERYAQLNWSRNANVTRRPGLRPARSYMFIPPPPNFSPPAPPLPPTSVSPSITLSDFSTNSRSKSPTYSLPFDTNHKNHTQSKIIRSTVSAPKLCYKIEYADTYL